MQPTLESYLSNLMPADCVEIVKQHKAAIVIQLFFKRSMYRVVWRVLNGKKLTRLHSCGELPSTGIDMKHPRSIMHRSGRFTQHTYASYSHPVLHRNIEKRYKPLKISLKLMMNILVHHKRYKKSKMGFEVTLVKRCRFGELPIIRVTHDTVFKRRV